MNTYGKLPSQGFMNRNPNYRVAEHKLEGKSSGKGKPNVRPSNLDTFYAKQAGAPSERGYGGEVFAGDSSAEGVAQRLAETGRRTGFGGRGIEPNRNLSPRERRQMGLDGNSGGTRTPAGPTDDQRKWARNFREKSRPITTSTKPTLPPTGIPAVDMLTPQVSTATRGPAPAMNFSRSALVEGAKKSGDFDRVRGDYNRQSAAAQTGMRMNERGSIAPLNRTTAGADGMTPYAREKFGPAVEDNRARRDFARGEAMDKSVSEGVGKMTKTNPYGSASATYGGKPTGPGMMSDPLTGKQVPMRQWASDQSAVQETKAGTSGWGESRTTNKAGDDYFNPQKIRQDAQQSKGGAQTPAAPGKTRTGPYDGLSTAMTGDTGTIKSLPKPRDPLKNVDSLLPLSTPGSSPQYGGLATTLPPVPGTNERGISAMSGNQTGMDTIKSPLPERSGPLNIPKTREDFSGGRSSSASAPARRSGGGSRK